MNEQYPPWSRQITRITQQLSSSAGALTLPDYEHPLRITPNLMRGAGDPNTGPVGYTSLVLKGEWRDSISGNAPAWYMSLYRERGIDTGLGGAVEFIIRPDAGTLGSGLYVASYITQLFEGPPFNTEIKIWTDTNAWPDSGAGREQMAITLELSQYPVFSVSGRAQAR